MFPNEGTGHVLTWKGTCYKQTVAYGCGRIFHLKIFKDLRHYDFVGQVFSRWAFCNPLHPELHPSLLHDERWRWCLMFRKWLWWDAIHGSITLCLFLSIVHIQKNMQNICQIVGMWAIKLPALTWIHNNIYILYMYTQHFWLNSPQQKKHAAVFTANSFRKKQRNWQRIVNPARALRQMDSEVGAVLMVSGGNILTSDPRWISTFSFWWCKTTISFGWE